MAATGLRFRTDGVGHHVAAVPDECALEGEILCSEGGVIGSTINGVTTSLACKSDTDKCFADTDVCPQHFSGTVEGTFSGTFQGILFYGCQTGIRSLGWLKVVVEIYEPGGTSNFTGYHEVKWTSWNNDSLLPAELDSVYTAIPKIGTPRYIGIERFTIIDGFQADFTDATYKITYEYYADIIQGTLTIQPEQICYLVNY